MPAFDLALGLRMIRRAAECFMPLSCKPFSQLTRDVAGAVVAQQTRLVDDMNLVATRCLQGQIERVVTSSVRMLVQSFHEMM